jgi:hypothetical protein
MVMGRMLDVDCNADMLKFFFFFYILFGMVLFYLQMSTTIDSRDIINIISVKSAEIRRIKGARQLQLLNSNSIDEP